MRAVTTPAAEEIPRHTDSYFTRTRRIVERFGDCTVTYAVFMRRPVLSAPRIAIEWLRAVRGDAVSVEVMHAEGAVVGAGDPILYVSGSFAELAELETILLQKLGPTCVAAWNAWAMCLELPHVPFLAMDARHCAGTEMAEMMAYAASVGSRAAQAQGAKGFIGNANDATAHWFGANRGRGTMPH
ncbi:MAG: nicotinate phosphoribosyltransferase, partial [Elioraea sp.]|nr:nicotinate phosphoribosyltransferase [Elioraea sp.]